MTVVEQRCAACGGRLVRVHDGPDVFLRGPNWRHVEGPCPGPRLRTTRPVVGTSLPLLRDWRAKEGRVP